MHQLPRAFSIIELLVALGVMSILLALLLPAVSKTRESARRIACSNHCRQLALASVHFETNRRKFAGSYFSSFPTGQAMSADEGSIVALLPYLEQVQLGGDLGRASLTFSREHAAQLAQRPSFLSCPSNLPPAKLVGLAPWFSSPDVEPILVVAPAEYVLCSGVFPLVESSFERSKGIFGIEVPGKLHPRGDSEVLDGYSNTIGGWETRGDALILPDGRRFDFDANVPSSYPFWISDSEFVLASGPGTTKAWVYGWSGLAAGTLNQFSPSGHRLSWHAENLGGRSVNVTNLNSGPMSLHLGGVNRWMLDGSASFLSADVDSQVLMRMCTIAGEEGHE